MKILNSFFMTLTTVLTGLCVTSCTEDSPVTTGAETEQTTEIERGTFARGADVSWVTELEQRGFKFYNSEGVEKELMTLLRDDCGINAIRLRVWVNPENDSDVQGWCNIDDVIVKARRAHSLGLRLMIDFHFSDTWADPSKQTIPAAWADMTLEEVKTAMAAHVTELLSGLKSYGIEPEWVQIGNETRTGMMWPLGQIDNGTNFTQMVNAGYDAVKAIYPDASVIVHVDCGNELYLFTRVFSKLESEGGKYDMIGMSLYPAMETWQKDVSDCLSNVRNLQIKYKKPVMVCEVGFDYREAQIANAMMTKLMTEGLEVDLKGIFWWEPEAPASRGYTKGCFDNDTPTEALDVFKQ